MKDIRDDNVSDELGGELNPEGESCGSIMAPRGSEPRLVGLSVVVVGVGRYRAVEMIVEGETGGRRGAEGNVEALVEILLTSPSCRSAASLSSITCRYPTISSSLAPFSCAAAVLSKFGLVGIFVPPLLLLRGLE